jgi:hypothetical protein
MVSADDPQMRQGGPETPGPSPLSEGLRALFAAGAPFAQLPDEIDWTPNFPDQYLLEAFTCLMELTKGSAQERSVVGAGIRYRQTRSAIVFAAFAAEGYINYALAAVLSGADFDAVDRLATIDKYTVGTRLAFGQDLFPRGAEPLQTLDVLFKHRNRLAHPKPSQRRITRAELLAGPDAQEFKAGQAARYVTRIAEAATILTDNAPEEFARATVLCRSIIRAAPSLHSPMDALDAIPPLTAAEYEKLASAFSD